MNWFKRHLNLSFTLALLFTYLMCFVAGFVMAMVDSNVSDLLLRVVTYIIFIATMVPVSVLVIRAKGRSLWWLLLVGWLSPLWLSNKNIKRG